MKHSKHSCSSKLARSQELLYCAACCQQEYLEYVYDWCFTVAAWQHHNLGTRHFAPTSNAGGTNFVAALVWSIAC